MIVAAPDTRCLRQQSAYRYPFAGAMPHQDGINEWARVSAAVALLDRGWGKPAQTHIGEDGEGDIRVTIRHNVSGSNGKQIEQHEVKQTRRGPF